MSAEPSVPMRAQNIAYLLRQLADQVDSGQLSETQLVLALEVLTGQLDPDRFRRAMKELAAGALKLAR